VNQSKLLSQLATVAQLARTVKVLARVHSLVLPKYCRLVSRTKCKSKASTVAVFMLLGGEHVDDVTLTVA